MQEWVEAARRLRAARTAETEFVIRAMVDRYIIGPLLLDRLADDLQKQEQASRAKLQRIIRADDERGTRGTSQ
ncbi:MAG TPA: hypothetical protein VH370_02015 [Humisphaera sp.]|nr:hypothetical protein [Humisphaera sp.]